MPKLAYCFFEPKSKKFGAVEIDCGKGSSLTSPEMAMLAKSFAIKIMDSQISDKEFLLKDNPQLGVKISFAEKQLKDKITISNIWI